ncbi:hydroxymethylglutaryl-CoA lyase [Echinicola jeungdonensis]|uniref:Hydroxymethylglutaryl-CoA lyase n=1 Tax=Echinicola jeungdonensis TaxID=709343 RepID=A0ABV5J0N6_9BACT|nr:hydroxymethylglutaryl-CoA lyase [Echinicola jeungdonensis]MDN3667819.1 hydroxymethylglutaryl-CoA lyase [Echinicola jeungdonensis]
MKIIECPRDAMQGRTEFIDTAIKAAYINQLLEVGFDTVDFGSFVSPKAMPQMRDTAELLDLLDLYHSKSKLLAIVANKRGAEDALDFEEIDYLGFPLSISETFQKRNTNKSISEALEIVEDIQNLCETKGRTLVTYLSMGFGNPYGEAFSTGIVAEFVGKLDELGIKIIALSDTIGVAEPELIEKLFLTNIQAYPDIEFGAHFHSRPETIAAKIEAGLKGGCQRFDGALKGFGGCPMAKDELVGNVATEEMIRVLEKNGYDLGLNKEELVEAMKLADFVFG